MSTGLRRGSHSCHVITPVYPATSYFTNANRLARVAASIMCTETCCVGSPARIQEPFIPTINPHRPGRITQRWAGKWTVWSANSSGAPCGCLKNRPSRRRCASVPWPAARRSGTIRPPQPPADVSTEDGNASGSRRRRSAGSPWWWRSPLSGTNPFPCKRSKRWLSRS